MNNDYNRMRLTSAGTKVFSRQESGKNHEPQFRVLGEGLPVVLPFVDPLSIIAGDMIVLKTLLGSYYPLCSDFDEPFKSIIVALRMITYLFLIFPFKTDYTEILALGSHIVQFSTGELWDLPFIESQYLLFNAVSSFSHDVVLPIWKSNISLSLMIDKKAKRFVLLISSLM
jgi:multisite-specific tRNA:(cytosine-C5)-methyltransferase